MSMYSKNARLAAAVLALTCVAQGCGTREYERRLKGAVSTISKGSGFQQLYGPTALEGTPITVRVPKTFQKSFTAGSVVDGAQVDPRRVKPPFMEISGLKITYEATVQDAVGGKMPYYCYLAAVPLDVVREVQSPDERYQRLQKRVSNALREKFPQASDWTDVRCHTPGGDVRICRKLSASGEQVFFYVDKAGAGSFRNMPGTLEFYACTEAGHFVLVGWRVPDVIRQHAKLNELAPLVAGSISKK